MNKTLEHVRFLTRHIDKDDVDSAVKCFLTELNVPMNLSGFRCLTKAVTMQRVSPEFTLTKHIYPDVGQLCEPTISGPQVEKDIRYAVCAAWENRNEETWKLYFQQDRRPTNGEFIAKIVLLLDLWQACYSAEESVV